MLPAFTTSSLLFVAYRAQLAIADRGIALAATRSALIIENS
jgi:hypothetical protein